MLAVTYVLPVRTSEPMHDLASYLDRLAARVDDVVVVDGAAAAVFEMHHDAWSRRVRHVPVDADLATPMGKVGGVPTGLRLARHRGDRYGDVTLRRAASSRWQLARGDGARDTSRRRGYTCGT